MIPKIFKRYKLSKMLKFLVPGAVFFVMLNTFFQSFGFSQDAVILLFVVSTFSAFWITKYRFLPIIPSTLLSVGSVMLLLTMGQSTVQKYFILFSSFLFVITLIGLYRFFIPREEQEDAEKVRLLDSGFNLNQAIMMFSIFFISSGIYGIYTILNIYAWKMMMIILVSTYTASYYLIRINFIKSQELGLHLDYYKNRTFNFYSLLMSILMVELTWAMTFLPINHLTFGAIILAIYYSYWNIIKSYLRNELTRKKFMKYASLMTIAIIFMLLSSNLYIN